MAKNIIATHDTSCNTILSISRKIEEALRKKSNQSTESIVEIRTQLTTLFGLSLTAVASERSLYNEKDPSIKQFLKMFYGSQSDFDLDNELSSDAMIQFFAEIIHKAAHSFKHLGFPYYYDDFVLSLAELLGLRERNPFHKRELKQFLNLLLGNSSFITNPLKSTFKSK